jgi:ATP-binding cassette, subfamily B, multidrug efflux pump
MNSQKKSWFKPGLTARILSYVRPYRWQFVAAVALTLILSALAIVRPLLISDALEQHVEKHADASGLNKTCMLILGMLLLETAIQVINLRLSNLLGQNIVRDLRNQVYAHILRLRNRYFDNTPVGTLVTRAISDIELLSEVFAEGFIVIAGDLLMLLIFIVVMLVKDWTLSLLALSSIPLLFVATALFKRGVKKTFTEVRNAVAALNTFTQEHLTGMKIVQVFSREAHEMKKFREINAQHRRANIHAIFYYSVFFPVVEILSSLSVALIIWFGGIRGRDLGITLGDLTFFVMMVHMLFRPIRLLADRLNTLQMGLVSGERVFKVLDTDEFISSGGNHIPSHISGEIVFDHVWFAYRKDHYVLKDVSFRLSPGETVALVGSTGAGKSTVINLLSRFYELDKGTISIDGTDIRQIDLDFLRKSTGVVLQDVYLFNDTILNNITLHNDAITPAMVAAAARETGVFEFIDSLPGGLHYQVTERGQGLSAGQRQLIAFVRAYVYRPAIFILDEATATIDTPTEILIQKAVERICAGRTSIIIAHRLSTIRHVDRILVFEKGEIVEQGAMGALLAKDSRFRQLYEMQFRTESID